MNNSNKTNNNCESTTVYLGNTRTISNEDIFEYCSRFGLILDCSRRLLTNEQATLVDFTFVRFLNAQTSRKFLATSSHILNNGICLDVRPFNDILDTAVPLHVDRKIFIKNLPNRISINELKKYLRTFGTIKQISSDINNSQEKCVYIEFESAASRNKLLKGKIRQHRINDQVINIVALLRPTDVDLYKMEEQNATKIENVTADSSTLIYLEHEYSIGIREEFNYIDYKVSQFIKQKRDAYDEIRNMIE